jgi:hypothetical protein
MSFSEFLSRLDPASVIFGMILTTVIVLIIGWLNDIKNGPDDGPLEIVTKNYLTVEPNYLDWMRGNRRELTLYRLAALRSFKMDDFVTKHLLTDPEWRKAKHELIGAGILEVKRGTSATLSTAGTAWVDKELYGTKQTNSPIAKVGQGDR